MNWHLLLQVLYYLFLLAVVIKIIADTPSSTKATAYILLVFLLPFIGVVIYFSLGLNYRKNEIYNKKMNLDKKQAQEVSSFVKKYVENTRDTFKKKFPTFFPVGKMLFAETNNLVTKNNQVKLLRNGEHKFPELLEAIGRAKSHIHIEYYIYDDDEIGNKLADALIEKAKEGVRVRFIYDDFGSRSIRKKLVPKMKSYGIEAFAFYKVVFIYLANRLNYRNHRKIVIIDGEEAFIGGINVSDKYINQSSSSQYWRDTHLMIKGEAVLDLQKIFIADWNFCSNQNLKPSSEFFRPQQALLPQNKWVQIVPSGPDSRAPSILYSFLQTIALAKREILITTPYLIPQEGLIRTLHMAVLRGVKVKILVPKVSDSWLVNAVCKSYFKELMENGIEIYLYKKGFIHAKTIVCDDTFSIVGTANFDNRSFDLNFEVNAIIYDEDTATELKAMYKEDLSYSEKVDLKRWKNRGKPTKFIEKVLRLVSPLM